MANIYARLSLYSKKNDTKQVEIVVHLGRATVKFPTGVTILENEWDELRKCIKGKSQKACDNNLIIDNLKAKINNVLVKHRLIEKTLTPEKLRAAVKEAPNLNFIDFLRQQIERKEGISAKSTIQTYNSLITKLAGFRKEIFCADITNEFVHDFVLHMQKGLKNKESTTAKTITTLKQFVKAAKKKGLIGEDPFEDVHLSKRNSEAVFLVENELTKLCEIYSSQILTYNERRVLRYFLFSCFTGLRLVDVKRITKDNVVGSLLVVVPQKTKRTLKQVRIPLTENAVRMLKDSYGTHCKNTLFDCYDTDNTTRTKLKSICKKAQIKKNVTFHTARHTFATIFLRRNKNLKTLQALLGHSDIKETAKYSHVLDEDVIDEIKVFDLLFAQHLTTFVSPNESLSVL